MSINLSGVPFELVHHYFAKTKGILSRILERVKASPDDNMLKMHYTYACSVYVGDLIRNAMAEARIRIFTGKNSDHIKKNLKALIKDISEATKPFAEHAFKSETSRMIDGGLLTLFEFFNGHTVKEIKRSMQAGMSKQLSPLWAVDYFGDTSLTNDKLFFEFFGTSDDLYAKLYFLVDMLYGCSHVLGDSHAGRYGFLLDSMARFIFDDDEAQRDACVFAQNN